jgi:hypothetical protein
MADTQRLDRIFERRANAAVGALCGRYKIGHVTDDEELSRR